MYLIFDTETTGVPTNNWSNFKNARLIQLSWIIIDKNYNIKKSNSFYIKDSSYCSTKDSLRIHHITEDIREEYGKSFNEIINIFMEDVKNCKVLISHGIMFDLSILINELYIHNMNEVFLNKKNFICTKNSNIYIREKGLLISVAKNIYDINPNLLINKYNEHYQMQLQPHDALFDCLLCLDLLKYSKPIQERVFGYYRRNIGI